MDSDIEELESLFSEHFGRTPTASQASIDDHLPSDNELNEIDDQDIEIPDADERARLFLESLPDEGSSDDEENGQHADPTRAGITLPDNDPDVIKIRNFIVSGCGCHRNCNRQLSESAMYNHVLNIREMEKSDKELYIMATLIDNSDKEKTKRGKKRQRLRQEFSYQGTNVCKQAFMLLFDIGKHSLRNLIKHVNEHGVVARTHGNTGKKPSKSLTFDDIRTVVQFIVNYSDEFGIPQPAAPRGRDNTPPIYLTSDTTKLYVHEKYTVSCSEGHVRALKYSTFNNIWRSCLAHIKIATPRDDVCATCEKMRKCIMDAVTEQEKIDATNNMKEHVLNAQKERDVYNSCIRRAKESYGNDDVDKYVHYTFDFSQNVCIPHHSRQMGPLYFLSLRKIQIFGFRIDGTPKQFNFLVDENETIGKDGTSTHGPNAVISMIDWALQTHNRDETSCTIHADNCPGQNKNKYVLGYFMWRVMTHRHERIEYMMQVPGHARCLVDSGFASLKKLYRRSDCDSLDQLKHIVNKSSSTNEAVCYPAWQWRDWKSFLEPIFRPLIGIRQYQYFRMSSGEPGIVVVKQNRDADEKSFNILRREGFEFQQDTLPASIPAYGMSQARQDYLYKTVRKYVRPVYKDATCPQPTEN